MSKPTCTVCNGTGDQRYWEGRWRDEAAENDRLRLALHCASTNNRRNEMTEFKQYRRSQIAELRPYTNGEVMDGISISAPDKEAGSPKPGDMIARNPKNHADQWLVAAQYFADNFEPR
jgi:hypothetical protein